jgi:hypothetical protein
VTYAHHGLSSHSSARRYHASWRHHFHTAAPRARGRRGWIDLIINKTVIVEVKAARALDPVFARQLLTYLKIMNLRPGLLMNFGMATMKAGIRRIAN